MSVTTNAPEPTELAKVRRQAILYGALTVALAATWLALRRTISFKVALPIVGGVGLEAWKNLRRWHELRDARPGVPRVDSEGLRQAQQEAVAILSQAARAQAWLTRGTIACITIPSALMLFVGVETAVARASVDAAAVHGGDWTRLLTGTFLHGSIYHYLGNMSALLVYGAILESKTTRWRMPLVYFVSAFAGSALSVLMPPDVPSVGASGGIVGVIAYLYLFSSRQALKFPAAFHGATVSVFAGLVTAGALGFWYIDNPGHAGGALAGLVLAAIAVDPAQTFSREMEVELPLFDLLGMTAALAIAGFAALTCLKMLG